MTLATGWIGVIFAAALAGTAIAGEMPNCGVPGLSGVYVAGPGVYSGGVPDAEHLARLSTFGVRHVIDLRPADEIQDPDAQRDLIAGAGLSLHRLPVSGVDDIDLAHAQALDAMLGELTAAGGSVYVHCATGNRAGALIALRERELLGRSAEATARRVRGMGVTSEKLLALFPLS